MNKLILAVILCLATNLSAAAQSNPATSPPVPQSVKRSAPANDPHQESFEIVWRTVKEKHFDPTFGGVDWDQVRARYAPRVAAVKSDEELYELLQAMLGELRQSHFSIIPPQAVIEEATTEAPSGGVGLDLRILDGAAVITRVTAGSAAARAGLRPGFAIQQIDDKLVEKIREDVTKRMAQRQESPAWLSFMLSRVLLARINGKPGTSVRLEYLDERGAARQTTLAREKLTGELSPPFGNFPPQYTEFEAKRLADGTGYIRFNIFVLPQMEKLRAAIREMADAPGLVFDLRGNPGGVGGMAAGIAGLLETKATSLGTMNLRTGKMNFAVFPQKDPYTGPVAILIDYGSASTSELFAAGMQAIERAVVVGERSAGVALPSVFQKLPTGALFQYAIADLKTPHGVLIEGRGVIPDIEAKLSRETLLEGRDAQLEAALVELRKRARARK
jgi:carboxyl-terminal processing protease